jgi:hypothetical protein
MTTLREAAQQALEALDGCYDRSGLIQHNGQWVSRRMAAMDALKAALEQPVQCDRCGKVTRPDDIHTCTPRRLTDDEIGQIWFQARIPGLTETAARLLIRAAEQWRTTR